MPIKRWLPAPPPGRREAYLSFRLDSSSERLRVVAAFQLAIALALGFAHSIEPGVIRGGFLFWLYLGCFAFLGLASAAFLALERATGGAGRMGFRRFLLGFYSAAFVAGSATLSSADNLSHGEPAGFIIALFIVAIFNRAPRWFSLALCAGGASLYVALSLTLAGLEPRLAWIALSGVYAGVAFALGLIMDYYDLRAFVMGAELREGAEELGRAAAERALLLRELRHRVANNLALVSSLLSLESRRSAGAEAGEVFAKMRLRVDTVARMYDLLSHDGASTKVGAARYLGEIARAIEASYATEGLSFSVEVGDFDLDVKTAIPLGIILNELVADSAKYAFPGGRRGQISVRVALEDGIVAAEVADDGIGFPPGFDWRESPGLGFKIIRLLADQIGGKLSVEGAGGLKTRIELPLPPTTPPARGEAPSP